MLTASISRGVLFIGTTEAAIRSIALIVDGAMTFCPLECAAMIYKTRDRSADIEKVLCVQNDEELSKIIAVAVHILKLLDRTNDALESNSVS